MINRPKQLIQRYDEQGNQIHGEGVTGKDMLDNGLLHAAAHVWIWRRANRGGQIQVLLQKRADYLRTWPGRLDISAAGHIDLDDKPLDAAIREIFEEIGLKVAKTDLQSIGVERRYKVSSLNGAIENEFNYLYLLELTEDANLSFNDGEVTAAVWKGLDQLEKEAIADSTGDTYVPHGELYFRTAFAHIRRIATS